MLRGVSRAFDGAYKLVIGLSDGSLFSKTGKVACFKG